MRSFVFYFQTEFDYNVVLQYESNQIIIKNNLIWEHSNHKLQASPFIKM